MLQMRPLAVLSKQQAHQGQITQDPIAFPPPAAGCGLEDCPISMGALGISSWASVVHSGSLRNGIGHARTRAAVVKGALLVRHSPRSTPQSWRTLPEKAWKPDNG